MRGFSVGCTNRHWTDGNHSMDEKSQHTFCGMRNLLPQNRKFSSQKSLRNILCRCVQKREASEMAVDTGGVMVSMPCLILLSGEIVEKSMTCAENGGIRYGYMAEIQIRE